jgi:hypothetical protein
VVSLIAVSWVNSLTEGLILTAAVLVALGGIITAVIKSARFLRKADNFLGDWFGEPDRPGVPGHPGVMSRLGGLEERQIAIENEQKPNGGSSLRDVVDRVDERTAITESLVRQHLEDGRNLLDVGLENDKSLWDALRAAGIEIEDYKPLDRDVLDRNSKLYDDLFGQPGLFEDYGKTEEEPEA